MPLMPSFKRKRAVATLENAEEVVGLAIACILERLQPAELRSAEHGCCLPVCRSMRERCRGDHLGERHMTTSGAVSWALLPGTNGGRTWRPSASPVATSVRLTASHLRPSRSRYCCSAPRARHCRSSRAPPTSRSPLLQLASATGLTLGHAATRRVLFHYRSSRVSPATLPTGSLQEPLAGRGSPRCPAFARWYPGCGPRPRRHPLQSPPPPPSVVVEGKGERGRGKRE
jgi:hypothetical protein